MLNISECIKFYVLEQNFKNQIIRENYPFVGTDTLKT